MIYESTDALDYLSKTDDKYDLVVTDPPYAFSGSGPEHALSATVSVVLREVGKRIKPGGWMLVFCAASWRSQAYMVESVRGVLEPVRTATWVKPEAKTKARTPGWAWASVSVVVFRRGKGLGNPSTHLDWIQAPPVTTGRRAELPEKVALWAVRPFANPDGLFFDPFAGSGALVHAAQKCGMAAIGIEKNESVVARLRQDSEERP